MIKTFWKASGLFFLILVLSLLVLKTQGSFILSLSLGVGSLAFTTLFFAERLKRSLNDLSWTAHRIALEDFSKKIEVTSEGEVGHLERAMGAMAGGLESRVATLREEKAQLQAILEGMIEGVLVTDGRGRIVLVNQALQTMLCAEGICVGKTVLEYLRNPSIHEAAESVLRANESQEKEMAIFIAGEERRVIMHAARLSLPDGQRGSVSVFYDVTSIRRLEEVRKEFVANVSHELKTPLTCIRGYAETLKTGALNDPDAAIRFVEKIESNATQLQSLVEDILKLSEMESGRMELNVQSVNLKEISTRIVAEFAERSAAKQLFCENRIPDGLRVRADLQAFRKIIGNLVENAIKYTPEGGKFVMNAEVLGPLCRVTVADTGIGIFPKDLPRVFERFYRADKARSRQTEGTGLGLAIVKHLVQSHGGEVGVKSEIGKGSEFWVTLPL